MEEYDDSVCVYKYGTADTTSKSSKFQAAGLNLHGRYLPDQFRVGAGTQHGVVTILQSRPKW